MANQSGATCRIMRRYGGVNLEFKIRDPETKCKLKIPPGQHGPSKKRRETDYGLQLAAKQMLRHKYGVLERHFRRLYKEAARQKGVTGANLIQLLETRLDNVVFRMGFAATRREARQLVSHRAIMINGRILNIPSYQIKATDVVSVREKSRTQERIIDAMKNMAEKGRADWITVDEKTFTGTFIRIPEKDDLPSEVDVSLVVELYSK